MPDKNWFSCLRRRAPIRNIETPALRPANDNPWYCLATIHGEQPIDHFDRELAEKNRVAWEQWISSGGMNSDQRNEFAAIFDGRTSNRFALLEPATPADFSHTRFDRRVNLASFRFPWPVDFRSAAFSDANFGRACFDNKADFRSATFSGETKFDQAQFNTGGVDFESARFSNGVDFQHTTFTNANFRSAIFSGSTANLRSSWASTAPRSTRQCSPPAPILVGPSSLTVPILARLPSRRRPASTRRRLT